MTPPSPFEVEAGFSTLRLLAIPTYTRKAQVKIQAAASPDRDSRKPEDSAQAKWTGFNRTRHPSQKRPAHYFVKIRKYW